MPGPATEHPAQQRPLHAPPLPGTGLLARLQYKLRLPRKFKLTREGKVFLLIVFGVGFAAINTGNNLLHLLLGMLLALIMVSSVMSEQSLRRLTVVRRLPTRAQVGRPHLVEIEVYNHKRRIPSYAIEIEDLRAGQPADKRCFFLKISPRSAQVAAYRRTPARRGRDRHIGFRVATRFPFGLIEKWREIAADGDLIIYPAVDPVNLPPDTSGQHAGDDSALGRGWGDEIVGVRPMRDGDDPRDIYWPKSTVPGQLVLRDRARESRRHVTYSVDNHHPGKSPDEAFTARFERHIRHVASFAVAHLKRGDAVTLLASSGDQAFADTSLGADPALRFLALLEAVPAPSAPEPPETLAPPGHLPPPPIELPAPAHRPS
jgi:uncharacterized protein (DUF58 family)